MPLDPNDNEAVLKGVNEAAAQVRGLWISFITLMAYLAIATGSVTHRMLFEEAPLKLPILNVDLPLLGFFIVAPLFFVIFHFYLLLQTAALSNSIKFLNAALVSVLPNVEERDKIRRRLDGFVIVQMLAGPGAERDQLRVRLIGFVGLMTMVILPVAILLQIELAFLPYHSVAVTWAHRLLLVIDLVLLTTFWPAIKQVEVGIRFRALPAPSMANAISFGVVLFAFFIATFPGERIHRVMGDWIYPISNVLFRGSVGGATGAPDRPFSNILILADQKLVDNEKVEKQERTISARGRDLRGAIFVRADLRKADFTGANLDEAVFDGARLSNAQFGCAAKPDSNAASISIFGTFRSPDTPPEPHLWPEDRCTWLLAASFAEADLRGANFEKARLQSAFFRGAQMQGVQLKAAELQGASFFGANLDGALLEFATLYGASFHSAMLRFASLANAAMQGASLFNAQLDGASLKGASVYRVKQWPKSIKYAELDDINFSQPNGAEKLDDWIERQVAGLPTLVADHLKVRLASLRPEPEEDKKFVVFEARLAAERAGAPSDKEFEAGFSALAIRMACKEPSAPYIAAALVRGDRLKAAGSKLPEIAVALKNKDECLGAGGIAPTDRARLESMLTTEPH